MDTGLGDTAQVAHAILNLLLQTTDVTAEVLVEVISSGVVASHGEVIVLSGR